MRNEGAFWGKVREALHKPPVSLCRKLTDAFTAGTPDAWYAVDGRVGFLELKYLPAWPAKDTTLVSLGHGVTLEQRRYLDMLVQGGVPAWVLLGVAKDMFILRPQTVEAIYVDGAEGKVLRVWLETDPAIVRVPNLRALPATLRTLHHSLKEVV